MATLQVKYFLFFFSSESICQAAKNQQNEAKANGMRLIKKVHLVCEGRKINTCKCKSLWNVRGNIAK